MKSQKKKVISLALAATMTFGTVPFQGEFLQHKVFAAVENNNGWEVYWEESDIKAVQEDDIFGNFVVVNPDGKIEIDKNNKTFQGMEFNTRFKFKGKGDKTRVALKFDAPVKGELIVYAISGSSSDTSRYLVLEDEQGNTYSSNFVDGKTLTECKWELEQGGTYYLYASAGVNLYYISYEQKLSGSAPVIKNNSVQVTMPNQSEIFKTVVSGNGFSAKAKSSSAALIQWEIETAGTGDSQIKIEYKDTDGIWKTAGVVDKDEVSYEHDILEVPSGDLQYRVSGIGDTDSDAVYSNTYQWEQPRKSWDNVEMPQIGTIIINKEDGKKIDVPWEMVIGREGADCITISIADDNGNILDSQTLTEKETKGENSGVVSFVMSASGKYTIIVKADRETEEEKISQKVYDYKMPLETPAILSVQGQGEQSVLVKWEKTKETDYYEIYSGIVGQPLVFQQRLDKEETNYILTGLEKGQRYQIRVTAVRAGDNGNETASDEVEKYITGQMEREFLSGPVGSGAKGTVSGDFYGKDGKITIQATGGKIADSEDGFVYYYTELNPEDNFVMEATFTVSRINLEGTTSNQSGFGIVAVDTIQGINSSNGRYFNSVGTMTAKYKKMDTSSGAATSFDNLAGLRSVSGYTEFNANVGSSDRVLGNVDSAFIYPESNSSTKTYEVGDVYHFTLRRSNTGYHGILTAEDGTEIEKISYYPEGDNYTDPLLVQDPEHIYVGLMASRYIEVEVTDMNLTVLSKEDDEPRENAPKQYTIPRIDIYSSNTIGISEYPFEYRANIAGNLVVKNQNGDIIIEQEVKADEYVEKVLELEKGNNIFNCTLTPSQEEVLESYAPIQKTLTVSYKSYGTEKEAIIAAPNGTADGTGSEKNPLDIATALQYVQPGQTVLLKNGVYKLESGITAQRGHDGTEENYITITAETAGEVILDLSNSSGGLNISGDYWHIYGLDICNAEFGVRPVQVQGNYNKIELCKIYDNGDSGLQISGSSLESKEKWPSYNEIINCDAYDNADYKGNDADGFAAKLTCGDGNKFIGCISHHNIDDGWDLYAKSTTGSIGAVTIENCVTYANGFLSENARLKGKLLSDKEGEGNGFKLGGESMPGDHLLINSISFGNGAKGVTSNSGSDCRVQNVTIYGNSIFEDKPVENFALYTKTALETNYQVNGVISMSPISEMPDRLELKGQERLESETNYLFDGAKTINIQGEEAKEEWFESVDVSIVPERNADGSINMKGLFQLKEGNGVPDNAGARLEAIVSEHPIVPEAIKEEQEEKKTSSSKSRTEKKEIEVKADISQLSQIELAYMKQAAERIFGTDISVTEVKKNETGILIIMDNKEVIFQKQDYTLAAREWQLVDGAWYYFGNEGKALEGWILPPDGKWYYLDKETHQMKTGWVLEENGKWYYLDKTNGNMKNNWMQDENGKWYLLDKETGEMKTGWQKVEGEKWYYLGEDGSCFLNTITPDGYEVDENGMWKN